jgi:hypothetical protein
VKKLNKTKNFVCKKSPDRALHFPALNPKNKVKYSLIYAKNKVQNPLHISLHLTSKSKQKKFKTKSTHTFGNQLLSTPIKPLFLVPLPICCLKSQSVINPAESNKRKLWNACDAGTSTGQAAPNPGIILSTPSTLLGQRAPNYRSPGGTCGCPVFVMQNWTDFARISKNICGNCGI